jgi:hypothetical protein
MPMGFCFPVKQIIITDVIATKDSHLTAMKQEKVGMVRLLI